MAAYVPVPRDLSSVKTKIFFNLTRRQLICFGAGIVVGLPIFFLVMHFIDSTTAVFCMIIVMAPFFILGMYEKNGMTLEVILSDYYQFRFKRPQKRPYKTDNFYAALIRQEKVNKEVKAIVNDGEKGKAKERRETKKISNNHK